MSRRFRRRRNGPVCASVARMPWPSRFMADAAGTPRLTRRLEFWLPILIVLVDQVTKAMVRRSLDLHESMTVIPGFFDLTHVRNTGAAFGFLNSVDFPFKT